METHPRMAVISATKAQLKCRASVPKPRGQASGEFRAEDRTPRGALDSRIAVAAASRIISDFPTPRGGRTDRPAMMRSRPKPREAQLCPRAWSPIRLGRRTRRTRKEGTVGAPRAAGERRVAGNDDASRRRTDARCPASRRTTADRHRTDSHAPPGFPRRRGAGSGPIERPNAAAA